MAATTSSPRTASPTSTIRRSRKRSIKSLTYITTAFKEGYVPPGALSWNDADDNNAFHSKLIVMDFDGTISTEVAIYHDKDQYNDIVTLRSADRQRRQADTRRSSAIGGAFIPKGAKNVEVAKDFMKYVIEPQGHERLSEAGARPLAAGVPVAG